MSEEDVQKIFFIALAIGAVLLGSSALVAAINLGGAIVSGGIVLIFQGLITMTGIILLVFVAWSIASYIYSGIVNRMSALERSHGDILQKLNKRTPTFATSTALIATLILLLADKSFKGETIPTICVGVVLALLFWVANELFLAKSRIRNILGLSLWIVGLVFLPMAIYLHHAGNMDAVLQDFKGLGVTTISLLGLAFLVACFAPIALKENG